MYICLPRTECYPDVDPFGYHSSFIGLETEHYESWTQNSTLLGGLSIS